MRRTTIRWPSPKVSWPWVRTLLHSVFDQPDAESVAAQYDRIVEALSDKLPKVADHLENARPDLLAFTAFPKRDLAPDLVEQSPGAAQQGDPPPHRRRRNLPQPGRLIRLVGAVLAERHDEWTESRRYLGLDVLSKSRADQELTNRTGGRAGSPDRLNHHLEESHDERHTPRPWT